MVLAGAGNDLVSGGADADRLVGEAGDDVLYGGEEIGITAAYGFGESQVGNGERGDWIDRRSGEDIAIGDAGDDALFGGDAGDVLFGGGGADNLFGDRESSAIPFDWTITPIRSTSRATYAAQISSRVEPGADCPSRDLRFSPAYLDVLGHLMISGHRRSDTAARIGPARRVLSAPPGIFAVYRYEIRRLGNGVVVWRGPHCPTQSQQRSMTSS